MHTLPCWSSGAAGIILFLVIPTLACEIALRLYSHDEDNFNEKGSLRCFRCITTSGHQEYRAAPRNKCSRQKSLYIKLGANFGPCYLVQTKFFQKRSYPIPFCRSTVVTVQSCSKKVLGRRSRYGRYRTDDKHAYGSQLMAH
jgi:hypothetical protein